MCYIKPVIDQFKIVKLDQKYSVNICTATVGYPQITMLFKKSVWGKPVLSCLNIVRHFKSIDINTSKIILGIFHNCINTIDINKKDTA